MTDPGIPNVFFIQSSITNYVKKQKDLRWPLVLACCPAKIAKAKESNVLCSRWSEARCGLCAKSLPEMLARCQANRKAKLFCDKEQRSVLLPRCSRRAKGHCRDTVDAVCAPSAAACCPSLKPCCKKQFWCIAHEVETSPSWNATCRIQQCHLTCGTVQCIQRSFAWCLLLF